MLKRRTAGKQPETTWQRIKRSLLIIPSVALLIGSTFLFNVMQCVTAPLILISRPLVYSVNSFFAGLIWAFFQIIFEQENGLRIVITGDSDVPDMESALVISNHCSFLDFAMIHGLARKKGMIGNCRYFAKDSIKYIPFFGWGMYLAGMIFLKRNWAKDQRHINETFDLFIKYKLPVYLISFLEGSRVSRDKIIKSQEYSKANNLPVLENALLPRSKGFIASVKGLNNSHINYVYDLTLSFYHYKRGFGATPSVLEFLFGCLYEYQFRVHVERHALADLPKEDQKLTAWLYDAWIKKDARLSKIKSELQ